MEAFEQGLYLYFRRYQPSYPILHSVTFNSEKVSELLLFVMCMIGLSFFKTEDAVDFIRKTYPGILNEVYAQLIFAAADSQTPADLLNYLVLAHHTLFLFISTGTARQYGFFCSRFDQIHDMLFSPQIEERARWIAWTRAESTKKYAVVYPEAP
ncbi:hypothetical protein N7504_003017 [Penicillium tannophilum]|nr:hypothetical protein N7504_003017 [Penicillium tannophilum]